MHSPSYCDQTAYDLFVSEIGHIETDVGICNAVTAIAMHFDPLVCPQRVALKLDDIASQVSNRVVSGSSRALTAHLHHMLFDEMGFRGNTENFFDPKNSFLPSVLESQCGIPITLALVYKLVAGRCGLVVDGLNTPGHFLARLTCENERMIVDCFSGGKLLSENEVIGRGLKMTSEGSIAGSAVIEVATHRQWVARILANLIHTFTLENRRGDIAAVSELYDVLKLAY
ncbi:MAG: transglutaminase-like domain-containing protein [Pirellulaceae bacterium]|nr:transglutaminase-like domain-containing protein [Pirellulaceae bacterium]